MREKQSQLQAAKNITIMINYVKGKIGKTQLNGKCRSCGEKDEKIKQEISECSKLAQRDNKTRHNGVGKVSN